MTVDLQTMLDLRDLQVALDVQKKAELGYFDSEFTVYGCSYRSGGMRYYKVSAEAEKIYDFIEQAILQGMFPSNVMTLTKTCPVPIGMREAIAREVKRDLALQIREQFSADFFDYIEETAALAAEETAVEIIKAEQENVAGCFDAERLKQFQILTEYAYRCRKLSAVQYQQFMDWLREERKSMEEFTISKDIFEKSFYGVGYASHGQMRYVENARKAAVYAKKYQLEQQGVLVTPIFSKTYWYNYTLRLPDVHNRFEQQFKQTVNADYLALIQQIGGQNHRMCNEQFAQRQAFVLEQFGGVAAETFRQYGHRWGILL